MKYCHWCILIMVTLLLVDIVLNYKILLHTAVCILTSVTIFISRRSSWSGQQTWPRPCTACPGTPTNCPSPRPAPPRWPTAPLCLVLTPRIPDNWRSASRTLVVSGRKVGQVKVKTNQTKIITSASKWPPPPPEKKITEEKLQNASL